MSLLGLGNSSSSFPAPHTPCPQLQAHLGDTGHSVAGDKHSSNLILCSALPAAFASPRQEPGFLTGLHRGMEAKGAVAFVDCLAQIQGTIPTLRHFPESLKIAAVPGPLTMWPFRPGGSPCRNSWLSERPLHPSFGRVPFAKQEPKSTTHLRQTLNFQKGQIEKISCSI